MNGPDPAAIDVSIIMAAYNVAPYIERAVHSALNQQGVSIEVIVVDDRSTDDTWAALQRLQDPRLRTLQAPRNGGPGQTRNLAIEHARAPWIAVLDGDDALAPHRLRTCLDTALARHADLVADNPLACSEATGQHQPMFTAAAFETRRPLDLAGFIRGNSNFIEGYSLGYLKPVISSAFLKQHGIRYRTDIQIGEDYFLMLELLAAGARCELDPSHGYHYTVRQGSTSHRLTPQHVKRIEQVDDEFFRHHKAPPEVRRAQNDRTTALHEALAYNQIVEHLKQRHLARAVLTGLQRPLASRHLWLPLRNRLRRALGIKP